MTIGNVYKRPTITVKENASLKEAADLMVKENVGFLVVTGDKGDFPTGILTDRDMVINIIAKQQDSQNVYVKDIMSKDLLVLDSKQGIKESLQAMGSKGVRRAPIVENDKIIGMVSFDDLIILLAEEFSDLAKLIHKQID